MIVIGENVSALIRIEDFEVTSRTFYKIVLKDGVGGQLPILELTLIQRTYTLYSMLDTSPIIDLKIGSTKKNQFSAKYKVKDFNYSGDRLVITAILDLPDHLKIGDQMAWNDTLSNILPKFITGVPVTMDVETKDKQVWIRDGGMSEWEFVNESIMHGWVSEKDALLHGYTMDGNLVISSIEGVLGRKEFVTLSNVSDNKDVIRYGMFKPESSKAIWDKSLVRRKLPVFHIVGRKVVEYKNLDLSTATDLVPLPQLTDCGNCHEFYYQALMNYISKAAQLSFNNFFMEPTRFLDITTIPLLSKVVLNNPGGDKVGPVDPMNGSYIVSGRSVVFTIDSNLIRYELIRGGFGAKVEDTGGESA